MTLVELDGPWTLLLALATIAVGQRLNRFAGWLERGHIPPAVSAGLLLSLLFALARHLGWFDLRLTAAPRDMLLLVFFASLGFGAHLKRLATAGRSALTICLAIAAAIVVQSLAGMAVARGFGEPAALGLFMGSISFLGGHGTATAWAASPQAQALPGAFEVGIGSATLGLVLGGLVAGPVAAWMMHKRRADAAASILYVRDQATAPERAHAFSSDRWLPGLTALVACLALGPILGRWIAEAFDMKLPAFLTVMLVGVVLTNLADLGKRALDTDVTDLVGTVALRIFLAIAMLGLDWAALARYLPMLLSAAAVQVLVVAAIAAALVYLPMGRDREAATAGGGFIGFALGAMPVGLAVMRRLDQRFGDTPRALLAITLAASLFTDTANALFLTAMFGWLTP